jgi:hypothetical protein
MPPIVPFEPINPMIELMEQFVSEYPTSVKQNQATLRWRIFILARNYPQALQWFDKVDESSLSRSDLDKFNFQKGYSFLMPKKKRSIVYLNKVVNSAEYGSQAKYYLGFMAMKAMITSKLPSILMKFQGKKIQRKAIVLSSRYEF